MHSQGTQGAAHATPTFIQHMRVDHRGSDIRMAQQLLHSANVVTGFKQMGGKAMAQYMRCARFGDSSGSYSPPHHALQQFFICHCAPRARVTYVASSDKHILPAPFFLSMGIFPCKRIGQVHISPAGQQICLVDGAPLLQMCL